MCVDIKFIARKGVPAGPCEAWHHLVAPGCWSDWREVEGATKKDINKLIKYLEKLGGYNRAIIYLNALRNSPGRVMLEPVDLLRRPLVTGIKQRPAELPGPEQFIPHRMVVTIRKRR
jgi:hypothetical protein